MNLPWKRAWEVGKDASHRPVPRVPLWGKILRGKKKPVTHHSDEAADELEVLEVVGVDVGRRVDLQTVVVLARVLEQAVHRVQNLVGQQEEPLPVTQ